MIKKVVVFFRWCAFLLFLAALVAGGVAYRRVDAELRRIVRAEFRQKYPNVETSFESVRLDSTRGVRIRAISWKRPNAPTDAKPLLEAEEIYVECPIEWKSLAVGKFKPRRIVITRPQMRTSSDFDAFVADLTTLRPVPDDSPCPIEIYDGAILFDDAERDAKKTRNETPPNANSGKISSASAKTDDFRGATIFSGLRLTLEPSLRSSFGGLPRRPDKTDATSSANSNSSTLLKEAQNAYFADSDDASNDSSDAVLNADQNNGEKAISNVDSTSDDESDDQQIVWTGDLRASNPYVRELRVRGFSTENDWSAQGAVDSLDFAPFVSLFRSKIDARYQTLQDLRGRTSFDFETSRDPNAPDGVGFKIDGELSRGAFVSSILKYPLSDVDVQFSATEKSASVSKATARCGTTVLTSAYRQKGPLAAPTSAAFRLRLNDFPLDDELLRKLATTDAANSAENAKKIQTFLDFINDYKFSATTNVDLTVEKSNQTANSWTPTNLVVDGENLNLLCVQFPYQLERLSGRVALDRAGTLTLALHSEFNERKLKITGKFDSALDDPRGGVAVEGLGYPIDAKLLSALPPSSGSEIARLHPSGTIDADVRINYEPNRAAPLQFKTTIGVRDASIQYDAFPLPISGVGGLIKMEDDAWIFSNLSGKSGSARLRASGSLVSGKVLASIASASDSARQSSILATIPLLAPSAPPLAPDAWRFELTTDVDDFPLGEELRGALVEFDGRETVEQIRLDGKADGQIRLAYRTDARKLDLEFDATPVPGSASMKPDAFPYELKEMEGRVVYRAGELQIDGWRGRNGSTTYSANVRCRFSPQTGWTFDLSPFRVDQFQLDRDLQSAAPPDALAFLDRFQPSGFFNIDGALQVSRGIGANAPLRAAWDVRVVAQQNAARPGVALENLCGRVKLRGIALEGGPLKLGGELDLDSFNWNDWQISNLVGPFYYDGQDFYWGRKAPPPRRSSLYQDPFLRKQIDADPLYRIALNNPIYRAQAPSADAKNAVPTGSAAGFDAPDAIPAALVPQSRQTQHSQPNGPTRGGVLSAPTEIATDVDALRPVQAVVFNGQATTDGILRGGQAPTYRLDVNLKNARLDDVSREFAPGSKPLPGRVAAFASLQGEGKNVATLKGEGGLSVQDAALYELPQIVKIFQLLSVQEPDQTAFNSALVDFQVIGDRLKLSSVVLEGNSLTLFGNGWLTVHEKEKLVDLTLNSRLGNSATQIPIVSDVLGGAGDQLAQIRVEGDISAPVIRQDRFPGVKKAWWSVFPEQEPTPTDKVPTERPRPIRDALRKLTGTTDAE